MQKYQSHDLAARRAEVARKARISAIVLPGRERIVKQASESQRMVMIVRENAYHIVVAINRMPTSHPCIRSAANAKKPRNGRIAGKSHWLEAACEAPFE